MEKREDEKAKAPGVEAQDIKTQTKCKHDSLDELRSWKIFLMKEENVHWECS